MDEIRKNSFVTPINNWIDRFKPRHAQNNGVHGNRCNVEGLSVRDTGNSEIEGNFAINVCENSTICKVYIYQVIELDRKTQIANQHFMNKVQCSTRVNQSLNITRETNK